MTGSFHESASIRSNGRSTPCRPMITPHCFWDCRFSSCLSSLQSDGSSSSNTSKTPVLDSKSSPSESFPSSKRSSFHFGNEVFGGLGGSPENKKAWKSNSSHVDAPVSIAAAGFKSSEEESDSASIGVSYEEVTVFKEGPNLAAIQTRLRHPSFLTAWKAVT
jgi:hypothetical protein